MTDQTDREAIIREMAKKRVRYQLPGVAALPPPRTLRYRDELVMNIYSPANTTGHRAPVVVLAMGYPDPQSGIRTFGPFTSWAQLFAASGIAAVIYGCESPAADIHRVLAYIRAHAGELDINEKRIALFATSGHAPVALSTLMQDRGLAAAVLLCAYTMDLPGATSVAGMAAQAGFSDACAGRSVDELPADVPLLFVRAGRDQFPGLNNALDALVARGVARNLPLTLVNHASGAHGFEYDEDSPIAGELVRQVLAFVAFHLKA
ncbi:MAG TPA: hypothetical protein VLV86_16480 [Vicinamibacterales bacterium]|nr:hypothetical protein [Vicinamibacterales bacterium]